MSQFSKKNNNILRTEKRGIKREYLYHVYPHINMEVIPLI